MDVGGTVPTNDPVAHPRSTTGSHSRLVRSRYLNNAKNNRRGYVGPNDPCHTELKFAFENFIISDSPIALNNSVSRVPNTNWLAYCATGAPWSEGYGANPVSGKMTASQLSENKCSTPSASKNGSSARDPPTCVTVEPTKTLKASKDNGKIKKGN